MRGDETKAYWPNAWDKKGSQYGEERKTIR